MKKPVLALAVALALPLALAQSGHDGHSMPTGSPPALGALAGRSFDVAFMSQMIVHHQGAVKMAQALLDARSTPALGAAATDIVLDQEYEIGRLTGWLRQWYGTGPDEAQMAPMNAHMKPMMDGTLAAMNRAVSLGADPGPAFIEGMVPHHREGIAMATFAIAKGARPELKAFARAVVTKQTLEIELLRTLTTSPL